MIQLEQAPNLEKNFIPEFRSKFQFEGLLIAIFIIILWAISQIFLLWLDFSKCNILILLSFIIWQTFLYTGLFITAHDAMHGLVLPNYPKINHFVGSLCLKLYGLLPYQKLLKKHWLHHQHPAGELDPDFHDGKHENFIAWYFHFMKSYGSWRQIISIVIIYRILLHLLRIPAANLNYFWALPSLFSSLQLFYFGTFIPHKQPIGGYIAPHNAQTIDRPMWWSFITCYHFGYHKEHHEYPHIPWWQLPEIYTISKNKL
ncbi:beta-carotene ketolase [Tolypothrix sp. PCC 7910]|uniref:beta-carotene ketolase CrtW n=1 Tax=Tolypothrix sp. PCC 7910 TaxID=2099387 RepID=UPI001253F01F|nr:fatty acid desaturase [Tolypothrix sp. PCC 7910]QEI47154.1 beta carotene ketolase [Tolypothrix sp. PCC 7910]QIR38247.1 beta-carotene ketolase [Tolypothrix sp. PCC 7910]